MNNILNRGFSKMPLNDFIAKVKIILAKLTGNAYFLTTDPTLAAIAAQLDVLEKAAALADPEARDKAVAAARPVLEQMLDDLADNLEKTANRDPVKLATTGFDSRQEATPSGDASMAQNVRLKLTGISGECQVLMDGVAGVKSIQVQTCADPNNGPWVDYDTFSSSRGIVLKGFPRAKDLWVRVRTIGTNNSRSPWSDPATILIA